MNSLVKSNLSQIKKLINQYGVIRAHLFGNAANGTMTDDSDVDFMVSFKSDLSYTEFGDN
jgi:predicted nucleotidyltransferase